MVELMQPDAMGACILMLSAHLVLQVFQWFHRRFQRRLTDRGEQLACLLPDLERAIVPHLCGQNGGGAMLAWCAVPASG